MESIAEGAGEEEDEGWGSMFFFSTLRNQFAGDRDGDGSRSRSSGSGSDSHSDSATSGSAEEEEEEEEEEEGEEEEEEDGVLVRCLAATSNPRLSARSMAAGSSYFLQLSTIIHRTYPPRLAF
jgi:hypothetical protein